MTNPTHAPADMLDAKALELVADAIKEAQRSLQDIQLRPLVYGECIVLARAAIRAYRAALPAGNAEPVARIAFSDVALLGDIFDFLGGVDGAASLRDRILAVMSPSVASPLAPAEGETVALPDDNDGIEQDAFEEWAEKDRFDMEQHPLHWLFLDKETSAARRGWRAALRHANARMKAMLASRPTSVEGETAWPEMTGEMWSAGRTAFVNEAERYHKAERYEETSIIADRAPEKIFEAMRLASRPTPSGEKEQ